MVHPFELCGNFGVFVYNAWSIFIMFIDCGSRDSSCDFLSEWSDIVETGVMLYTGSIFCIALCNAGIEVFICGKVFGRFS